jgi:ribonuclease HI
MGAGAVVQVEGGRAQSLGLFMGRGTNNEAEYHGLLLALRHALAAGADEVTVHGDSQLILRQVEGRYRVKAENLRSLNEEARRLLGQFATHRLEWVPRAQNAEADAAARAAVERRGA